MTYPVLYLFPRTDLASMNPGKAMAHAAHGANAFVHGMHKSRADLERLTTDPSFPQATYNFDLLNSFQLWENSTPQGFGTTIVLQGAWQSVLTSLSVLSSFQNINTGISTDPTYPYVVTDETASLIPVELDTMPRHPGAPGQMVLYRKEDTCAWAFGMKDNPYLSAVLGKYSLHP
jgi:hypothetical protein